MELRSEVLDASILKDRTAKYFCPFLKTFYKCVGVTLSSQFSLGIALPYLDLDLGLRINPWSLLILRGAPAGASKCGYQAGNAIPSISFCHFLDERKSVFYLIIRFRVT